MTVNETGAIAANTVTTSAVVPPEELISSTQFLDLLVAQIQNQNPLEPLDGTEWATQLAEFANLEQLTQVNEGLDGVSLGQEALWRQQSLGALGHDVMFAGNEVELQDGQPIDLHYGLERGAREVEIRVIDVNGRERGVIRPSQRQRGLNQFSWDGTVLTSDGSEQLPAGTYRFEVSAIDEGGTAVLSETYIAGQVTGLAQEANGPVFIVGDRRIPFSEVVQYLD